MVHVGRSQPALAGNRLDLIGVPTDVGASCRGSDLGPDFLRVSGLVEALAANRYAVRDLGDIVVDRELPSVVQVDRLAARVSAAGYQSLGTGARPVFLGGDHSISMGSVAGVARHCRRIGQPLFVLWLDAHGDYNTWATTETGNIHGMSLARLCGEQGFDNAPSWFAPIDPANVLILGARSLDCEEAQLIDQRTVQVVDMDMLRVSGVAFTLRGFLDRVEAAGGHLHLSFDIDALDPSLAPGVGTPVDGGLSLEQAEQVMDMLHECGRVGSIDLVELNPLLDRGGTSAEVMIGLTARLLGEAQSVRRLAA